MFLTMQPYQPPPLQAGIALIESLIALVVLAVGLLGLVELHMQTLRHAQNSASRLQAIRLIEDLADRMRAHPNAHSVSAAFLTQGWAQGDPLAQESVCHHQSCSAADLAHVTRMQWLHNVAASLPLGQGHIFPSSDPRQLGVMVAWRSNEGLLAPPPNTGYDAATCPPEKACHLQYLYLGQGCTPLHSAYCAGN